MSEQGNPQDYVGDGTEQPDGTPYHEPQYEASEYEASQFEAPQYEGPQYGTPQYGTPQYEAPQYEAPQFDPFQSQAPGYQPEVQPYPASPSQQPYQPEAQAFPAPGQQQYQPYQEPPAQQPYQPEAQAFPAPEQQQQYQPYQEPPAQQAYPPVPAYQPQPAVPAPYPGMPVQMSHAPFGIDPVSGLPFSEKSKVIAGVLQIVLGSFGVGRFYMGNYGMAIAQILVTWLTLGIGAIWPLVDGIMILVGSPKDAQGRPLRS